MTLCSSWVDEARKTLHGSSRVLNVNKTGPRSTFYNLSDFEAEMPDGRPPSASAAAAAASKPSTTSTVVSAFRRLVELTLMLVAALAALFFYKSAEEKERERDRLEKARFILALYWFLV